MGGKVLRVSPVDRLSFGWPRCWVVDETVGGRWLWETFRNVKLRNEIWVSSAAGDRFAD